MHGGNARLSAAVAFAMVLHKAPAALGLSTFLIAAHWSKIRAVRALVAFAAASPVAAVVTAVLLGLSPFLSHPAGAALCVIFSGGTFLYAACVHVLPEAREAGPGGSLSRYAGHMPPRILCPTLLHLCVGLAPMYPTAVLVLFVYLALLAASGLCAYPLLPQDWQLHFQPT